MLTVTPVPAEAKIKTKTFQSSNEEVATVTDKGEIKAVSVGTADITVKADGAPTEVCRVKVVREPDGIQLSSTNLSLKEGDSTVLTVKPVPSDAEIRTKSFESSDTKVAAVDNNGKISAVSAGVANITVKVNGTLTGICRVTVTENSSSSSNRSKVTLNKKSLTLSVGQKTRLTARFKGKAVLPKYKSTNTKVASIDKKGVIKAKTCGTVKIKATGSNGSTAVCTVKVVPAKVNSFKAAVKAKTVTLRWQKPKNVSGFKIYRSRSLSGKYEAVKTVKSTKKNLVLKGQKKGTYYYKIRSYSRVGGKTYLSPVSKAVRVKVK